MYGVYNTGEVELNAGQIDRVYYGIYNGKDGQVTSNGTTFLNTNRAIHNSNGEVLLTTNSVINATSYGIYDSSNEKGTITVNGGTITAQYGIDIEAGKTNITINDVTITATSRGLTVSTGSTCELKGGTINSTGGIGVYVYDSANFKMTGGNINAISSSNVYGIETITYTNKPIVVIEGGTITATATNTNGVAYGIYMADGNNNGRNQSVTIGNKENAVNQETPIITGTTYGVYNYVAKELNIYDGKIIGKSGDGSAIEGCISDWPEEYEIITDLDASIETAYLSNDTKVAQIGTIQYKTLKDAFNACPNNTETKVEVLRNIIVGENIEILSNQNIVLDLSGRTISTTCEDQAFTNNGTLKIINSSSNGKIKTKNGKAIENNGTMLLNGGSIIMNKAGTLILNNGTMTIENVEDG